MSEHIPKVKWKRLSETSFDQWMFKKKTEQMESTYQWKSLTNWPTPRRPNSKITSEKTILVVNTIYKITENTRFQARVAMEIFEQLQYVLHGDPSPAEANSIIANCAEQSKRLAVFGLATTKSQERDAREFSDKALNIPVSIKHL
ncbi:MAG: hypothetical protein EXX96DRAFT_537482 [Benjaminiella poitrasii]|nr:MAG: hypothetical protein EXX96DRAFT_537482 [Benjaminiella poitrasii]